MFWPLASLTIIAPRKTDLIANMIRTLLHNASSELMRMSLLGLISGICASLVIVLFRFVIEASQGQLLPNYNPENYEALPLMWIFLFPLLGGVILGVIFHFIPEENRKMGVVHTLECLQNYNGKLPLINTIAQFVGASISIIAGHSVGREGPSIHLGASTGSLLAQKLNLSDEARHTLLACGVAAAIAASFNTPIAGVIFSLELIIMEYRVNSLMPIIIAALVATIISRAIFGNSAILDAPNLGSLPHDELFLVIITGILIGLISVIFIRLLVLVSEKSKPIPVFIRLTLAGAITGLLALLAPQIMGIGYDTVADSFQNNIALGTLLLICVVKILATTLGLGLGLPGGLIGPTLFIGAITGSTIAAIIQLIAPESVSSPAIYAMIGMGAMMGATLQAPLAALMAIFELTVNTDIILPGLLCIVAASLTSSELLRQPSVFNALMRTNKDPENSYNPIESLTIRDLSRQINKKFSFIIEKSPTSELAKAIKRGNQWLLIDQGDKSFRVIHRDDIQNIDLTQSSFIDLSDPSLINRFFQPIEITENLETALTRLDENSTLEGFYVTQSKPGKEDKLIGILSREDVSNYVTSKGK